MSSVRPLVVDQGFTRPARAGDNLLMPCGTPFVTANGANYQMTVGDMAGGGICFTGFGANRNITLPLATDVIAANPWMDIGDTFSIMVSVAVAFIGTFVTNTGMTLVGQPTCPANSSRLMVFQKTGAATMTVLVM